MTKISYEIESHAYVENMPCASPETCADPKHWGRYHDDEIKTLRQARYSAGMDDSPAVRIVKITRIETREIV